MPVNKTSKLKVESSKLKKEKDNIVRVQPRTTSLSVPVYSLAGVAAGNLELPKEFFGAEVNRSLLAQAMRVYLNNQKGHFSNTKTRGEVEGSTRKIYQQKGTGKARHGGIRAPIFVGGGRAMGPKYRKVILDLPKKMKKAALISALSLKTKANQVIGLSNLDKASGKTKEMVKLANGAWQMASGTKSILVVADKAMENAERALRNIKGIDFMTAKKLNAYEVIKHQRLVFTKEAVEELSAISLQVTDEKKVGMESK